MKDEVGSLRCVDAVAGASRNDLRHATVDWVREMRSVSGRRLELDDKRTACTRERVENLWLVDLDGCTFAVFELREGEWALVASTNAGERVGIRPFEAIKVRLGKLWRRASGDSRLVLSRFHRNPTMLAVRLPTEIEERLDRLAKATGRTNDPSHRRQLPRSWFAGARRTDNATVPPSSRQIVRLRFSCCASARSVPVGQCSKLTRLAEPADTRRSRLVKGPESN